MDIGDQQRVIIVEPLPARPAPRPVLPRREPIPPRPQDLSQPD